jgi:hypothetical protein
MVFIYKTQGGFSMSFTALSLILLILYPMRFFLEQSKTERTQPWQKYFLLALSSWLLLFLALYIHQVIPGILFAFELFIQNPFEAIGYLFLGLLYAVGTTIAFIMTIKFLVKDLNQLVKKDSSN